MAFASPSFDHPERPMRQAVPAPGKSATARHAGQQYRRAQVETASPAQLVILLYDGAIRFCALAAEAMQQRENEQAALRECERELEALPQGALAKQQAALAKRNAHLTRAQRALEAQNTNLIKTQRILGELMGSLDREVGGEVAANLFSLYTHMLERLVHANLYDDIAPVQAVQQLLLELRDAWQEADRLVAGGAAASIAPTPQTATPTERALEGVPRAEEPSPAASGASRGARATRLHTARAEAALPIAPRLREQSA